MDRRDFLKAAVALPAAASLPEFTEARPIVDVAQIKAAVQVYQSDGPWYAILHPQQERDLRDLAARDRWRRAYRAWRKAGKPAMAPVDMLDKYTPIHEWDVDVTEVGSYSGFRFIVQDEVPPASNGAI